MFAPSFTFLVLLATSAHAADIYVSPTGTGSGTITAPYGSIQSAVNAAKAGDTIHLRAGTYKPSSNIQITKSGTSGAPITLRSYESEAVVLDGENLPGTPYGLDESLPNGERGILHIQNANYWKFYNLELINGPYGVYSRDASHNYYERLSTHDNYESGFQMQGTASNNTIIYLDSYLNRDPRKNGESADGFALKEGSGTGNSLRNSRLWNNVDDGLDLWLFESPVTIEEVYSWGNGFNRWGFSDFEGDGNGFKLGGGGSDDTIVPAAHVVRNSIAWGNAKKGFIDNGNTGAMTLERNTAWNNGDSGFVFKSSGSSLKSNVAAVNVGSQVNLISSVKASGNSWDVGGTWANSTFKSLDATTLQGARGSDGRIKASDFLLPTSGNAIGATTREDV
ncbi:polysaccharide lyase family 9 protein [Cylindrobasidium torrendii FP15055 ss-10]|uniref:Polysaccharide lyase family 9 protein n=1 Tax=Cylindrobasidium torrendii FP15055 ss-10 TaxID=1314674 RepID=A0A0D7B914_9AGAR|nr:polysaccharide lyase family 9 protein [Cylindrobasidium torrendii FP15055 ss-10]